MNGSGVWITDSTALAQADILIAFKEFPHIDVIERAEELVEYVLATIRGEIRPVMAKFGAELPRRRLLHPAPVAY